MRLLRTFLCIGFVAAALLLTADVHSAHADDGLCVNLAPDETVQEIPADMHCTIRERFEVGGRQYVLAEFSDFRRAGRDEHIALARDIIQRAAPLYNNWFRTPDAIVFFGNEPASHAVAYGLTGGSRFGCVIYIDDLTLTSVDVGDSIANQFRRTIAHELFHCIQFAEDNMFSAMLEKEQDAWWVEGSAEYFAGLAFPESLPGNAFYADFTALIFEKPIYRLEESAYPFFAYLGRQRSPDAVVDLLRQILPTAGAASERATLQSVPGIDELFNEFNRALFDGLEDENGRPLPIEPPEVEAIALTESTRVTRPVIPYAFGAQRFTVAENALYSLETPEGDAAVQAFLADPPRAWRALPTRLGSCQHDSDGLMVYTSTADDDGPVETVFPIESEPSVRLADCQCPIGAWTVSAANMETMRASIRHQPTNPGRVSMVFSADGTARFEADGVVSRMTAAVPGGGGGTAETIIERDYSVSWNWTVRDGLLVMAQSEGMTITQTNTSIVSGAIFGSARRTDPPDTDLLPLDASSGRSRRFTCEGNQLIIGPPVVRVGSRTLDNDARALNYPHWGVFER